MNNPAAGLGSSRLSLADGDVSGARPRTDSRCVSRQKTGSRSRTASATRDASMDRQSSQSSHRRHSSQLDNIPYPAATSTNHVQETDSVITNKDRRARDLRAMELAAQCGLPWLTDDSSEEDPQDGKNRPEDMDLDEHDTNQGFQQVKSGTKRKHAQLPTATLKKQSVVTTSNKFAPLSADTDNQEAAPTPTTTTNQGATTSAAAQPKEKPLKVPPVTIQYTGKYLMLNTELKKHITGPVQAIYKGDSIKYHFASIEDHRAALQFFHAHHIPFYTHQNPKDKVLKVVIKYLPAEVPDTDVESELRQLGFHNATVFQFKSRDDATQKLIPQPVYCVSLPPGPESESIYDIKHILDTRVTVETYRNKDGPPQCKRCQRFFHTANYCTLPARCVRCPGHHLSKDCDKPRGHKPTCVNCNKDHAASWRGCEKFQEALRIYTAQAQSFQSRRQTTQPQTSVNIQNPQEFPVLRKKNPWKIPGAQHTAANTSDATQGQPTSDFAEILETVRGIHSFFSNLRQRNIFAVITNTFRQFNTAPDILSKIMVLVDGVMQIFAP